MKKKLETFDEMVDWFTWDVIRAILKGEELRSAIRSALVIFMNWQDKRKEDKNE